MPSVEKVTISLPADLLAKIEERRAAGGRSRSEVVTEWLWRGWRAIDRERMEEEYRRAYALQPGTEEERALAQANADHLFATNDDDWSEYWEAEPSGHSGESRATG